MIKLLGTAMIVLGSGSAGFGFARAVRAQLRQLNALLAALEAMKGEIEYRLTPLPELFAALGEGTEPVTAASVLTELLGSLDALGVLVLPAVPELPQPASSAAAHASTRTILMIFFMFYLPFVLNNFLVRL